MDLKFMLETILFAAQVVCLYFVFKTKKVWLISLQALIAFMSMSI